MPVMGGDRSPRRSHKRRLVGISPGAAARCAAAAAGRHPRDCRGGVPRGSCGGAVPFKPGHSDGRPPPCCMRPFLDWSYQAALGREGNCSMLFFLRNFINIGTCLVVPAVHPVAAHWMNGSSDNDKGGPARCLCWIFSCVCSISTDCVGAVQKMGFFSILCLISAQARCVPPVLSCSIDNVIHIFNHVHHPSYRPY